MTHYTGHPYMELMPPEFMSVHIRIDNIPQGKDWKQIRYFLSKFILRNQILNIKVLPSMPTMTPPFIPITSCICVLQPSVDWNNLLLQLNGFQWEYHTLGAILLPPSSLTAPLHPRHGSVSSHMQPQHQVPQHSIRSHLHHMGVPAGGPIPGLIPGSIPDGRQRSYYSPQQSQPPRNQQSHSQQQQQQQQQQQPRKLKQLFNETSFRKQMSSRSMYQIKFTNFPPCLHWDEIIKFKTTGVAGQHVTRASDVPSLIVKTTEPEIYGKLKWTMLKDFIKLNCPELFENTSSFEFYVGVYESGELDVEIQIKEGKNEEVVVSEEGPETGTAIKKEENFSSDHAAEKCKEDVREGSGDSSSDSPDVETSPKTVRSDVKDLGETKKDVIAVSETDSDKLKDVHLQEHQETEESEHKKSEEDSVQTDNSNGSTEKYMIKATIYEAVVGFVNYDKFLKCLHTFQGKEYGLSHKLVLEALESIEPN
ncbi:unnamed protein product [Kluyveromyces dobzhanskii CBS 2104]|uniref:WGS project CCBQ000000000 data, contig 00099 n=1 Tax=Kluyveromyces dobzhanskii CBS 2104 TaxID=1427455 RepID=A0A0A8L4N2_9SACH|nr:unnamed protein product [Kluyveromyces dobzhanskii CBS 2104]